MESAACWSCCSALLRMFASGSCQSMPPRHTRGSEGSVPGEKVPSNTWLISMIAGGSVRESEGSEGGIWRLNK